MRGRKERNESEDETIDNKSEREKYYQIVK